MYYGIGKNNHEPLAAAYVDDNKYFLPAANLLSISILNHYDRISFPYLNQLSFYFLFIDVSPILYQ